MNQPIRILHVVTSMDLGGIETLLMSLYRKIDKSKVQFDFLVHREKKGFFDEEIISLGGRIHHVQPLKPIKLYSYYKQLTSFFEKNKGYSIVHSHLNTNSSVILEIAKRSGIKHRICHAHTDQTGGAYPFLKRVLKNHINNVSTIRFACSQQAGKWLFGDAPFEVFINSIDTEKFRFDLEVRKKIRDKLEISESTIVIGNIARFNKEKNHSFMIDIFNAYLKINTDSKLLLIGEGNLLEEIKDKAKSLGVLNKLIFTGAIGNANEYLNAMDLFLLPSLYEGLGIVAVEAQSNGLPVLMTDNLPREVEITDLINRLSLNENAECWARNINYLVKKEHDRSIYQKQIIKKGYDILENANKLTKFYNSLK